MPDSLSDRLARAAHGEFVGRQDLCEEFLRAVGGGLGLERPSAEQDARRFLERSGSAG